jgi:hypothetical protein
VSGCAVGANGALLDTEQIDFYNDPDDLVAISGPLVSRPLTAASSCTSMSSQVPTTLDTFLLSSN